MIINYLSDEHLSRQAKKYGFLRSGLDSIGVKRLSWDTCHLFHMLYI